MGEHLLSGPASLFRGKDRTPLSMTFTKAHHIAIRKGMRRLGLTRSNFLALLVEKYADKLTDRGIPENTHFLYRDKVKAPVNITLTPGHKAKVDAGMVRLGVTRANFFAVLVEKYAEQVTV